MLKFSFLKPKKLFSVYIDLKKLYYLVMFIKRSEVYHIKNIRYLKSVKKISFFAFFWIIIYKRMYNKNNNNSQCDPAYAGSGEIQV